MYERVRTDGDEGIEELHRANTSTNFVQLAKDTFKSAGYRRVENDGGLFD